MDILGSLFHGFAIALIPSNLMYAFIGALIGTAIGVLPGLGPAATIALLLPITYWLDATPAIIMLAGIYYGSMYGGSTTSILLNIPGEASSVITCIDGYKMALKGRAGAALGIAAIGSFIAGTIGIIGLTLFAPPLARIALKFGPSEIFALATVGLLLTITLSGTSRIKSLIMVALGLFLGAIGADPVTGTLRFTFGVVGLEGGLDFVTLAMGTFGLGEILFNLESTVKTEILTTHVGKVLPSIQELLQSKWAIIRGAFIGFLFGIVPGGGATMSSIASYAVEKKYSRHAEDFGHGAIEGVAGPESANNAASSSAFITLLTLGIPGHAATAVIFSAMVMKGITPGPFLATQHPDLFWGFIASMYIGNVMLLVLNLPLVGIWVQMLRVPYKILAPLIILFSTVGVYCVNNDPFDIYALIFFGIIGYFLKKFKFEPGPLLIAFILGDIIEISMRQALLISGGDLSTFVTRPISGGILGSFAILVIGQIIMSYINRYKTKKEE